MTSPSPLARAAAVFGLSALLVGLVLPVASLVLVGDSAPRCCTKGRCCCANDSVAGDQRTCLRRGCGCDHAGEPVSGEPLGVDAVLPAPGRIAVAPPAELRWAPPDERPIARSRQPVLPPPRRSLPA